MKSKLKFNFLSLLIVLVGFTVTFSVSSVFAEVSNQPAAIPTQTIRTGDTALPSQNPSLNVPIVTNPNNSAFKIVICDGPAGANINNDSNYVVCDFNGAMLQVQHLINIMMVLGVLVAIVMFSYAGGLYITGKPANIEKAHAIFPKVFFGFIIMLSAWFIVYQILGWLAKNDGFKTLLGNP